MEFDFKALLKTQGISKALIVDDGVDPIPFVSDLVNVGDEWSVFWADLTSEDEIILNSIYPEYSNVDAEELIQNQAFISLMFKNREKFSGNALENVFAIFLDNQLQVRRFIKITTSKLDRIGFSVNEAGRDFADAAINVDLLIIDLYLGSGQAEADKKRSIQGLKNVLQKRPDNPPMVLLTSAHNSLRDFRNEFRDETRLLASGFRTIKKSEIVNSDGQLEQLVFELVKHRKDVLRLWTFLTSWESGIPKALSRAQSEVRKLDLEDLSHVNKMLSSEGVPLGGYMVGIMDSILAHEIGAEKDVIQAAIDLNELEAASFPPNSITGNKNTLEVVRKTMFVNENRFKLDAPDGSPVSFGDILAISEDPDNPAVLKDTIFDGSLQRVFLVLTPSCDLIRTPKAKRILLLAGDFHDHSALNYKQAASGEHTPLLVLGPQKRGVVKWDKKHIETIDHGKLSDLLNGDCYVAARLREHAVIALQQKLLSDLGRVGELKAIPSMFPVQSVVFFTDKSGQLVSLETKLDGVLVGGESNLLAFDAEHRFDFRRNVQEAIKVVHKSSKKKLTYALEPDVLDALFATGVQYKTDEKPKPCIVSKDKEIGKIIFNISVESAFDEKSKHQGMGLIFGLAEK
ncbi:MAG: hypothetical protein OXD44_06605 [Gammaproteobacteria bacterium]|nr:hypothetical protein [Gammaproteobacteria bacterium]